MNNGLILMDYRTLMFCLLRIINITKNPDEHQIKPEFKPQYALLHLPVADRLFLP